MNYIITFLLFTISLVFSIFYTSPLMSDISELSKKKETLNASLSESKNLFTIFEEKRAKYNNFTEEEIKTINNILPDSIDNVKLIIDIDNIASKYGMKLRSIELKAESTDANDNPYGTAILRFVVSSDYNKFMSFMNDLEDSMRLLDISSIGFEAGARDTSDYKVELKTYWLKEII